MQFETYLKKVLNTAQYEAATYDGNSLILAGAGAGKTRVLTYKIAYLVLEKWIHPANILAVTFTNKAANEMKERLVKIVEEVSSSKIDPFLNNWNKDEYVDFDDLISDSFWQWISRFNLSSSSFNWIWTFHSIFLKILKFDIEKLDLWYNKNFGIYDTVDSIAVIKEILKESKLTDALEPKEIKSKISKWKNKWRTWQKAQSMATDEHEMMIAKLYEKYQKFLQKSNMLDFDDLLLLPYVLFQLKPEILTHWQNKFKQILVDEAQDTNWIQFELIKMLSLGNIAEQNDNKNWIFPKVTFIWDDFQSIYWWRGAEMENFLNVSKWWPDIKVFKLEINYRSRPHIVEAGNCIIKNNQKQYDKNIQSYRQWNDKIRVFERDNEIDEAIWIVQLIKNLYEKKWFKWSDFAILYRTNAQSQPFEQVLLTEGIPYKVWWWFKFFERKEVKDIVSYLRYIYNPKDAVSLKRIINTPWRKIWPTTISKLEEFAIQQGINLHQVIENIDSMPIPGIWTATKNNIKMFNTTMKFLKNQLSWWISLSNFIKNLVSTIKYKDYLINLEWKDKAEERRENISQLINMATKYDELAQKNWIEGLKQFLDEISTLTDIDTEEDTWDFVKLMTIHASKWLEFPIVFIVGLEENVFPLSRAKFDEKEMEEERRLMYVAITRAKDLLFLSYAKSRQKWWNVTYNKPSRFISELPEQLLNFYWWWTKSTNNQVSNIEEWDIVKHKLFGKWEVLEVWKNYAIVKFFNQAFGIKKVDCKFLEK